VGQCCTTAPYEPGPWQSPWNPLLKEREIAFCLRDSGARVIFVWDAFKEEAEAGAKN